MPHIQIDINKDLKQDDKKMICKHVSETFSTVMKTGKDHIAISIREFSEYNLYLGQVTDSSAGVVLINIDLRAGRTNQQRDQLRIQGALALSVNRAPIPWLEVDSTKMEGVFKLFPEREELPSEINENLIVELYSK